MFAEIHHQKAQLWSHDAHGESNLQNRHTTADQIKYIFNNGNIGTMNCGFWKKVRVFFFLMHFRVLNYVTHVFHTN